jgi:hypothetical protein
MKTKKRKRILLFIGEFLAILSLFADIYIFMLIAVVLSQ